MKKIIISLTFCVGVWLISVPTIEAKDIWAGQADNGDTVYVRSETVYNDGVNFGCQVKAFINRSQTYEYINFYFGLDTNGNWFCMEDGQNYPLVGYRIGVFNVAKSLR